MSKHYYLKKTKKVIVKKNDGNDNDKIKISGADIPADIPYRIIHGKTDEELIVIELSQEVSGGGGKKLDGDEAVITTHQDWWALHPEDIPEEIMNTDDEVEE